MKTIDEKFLTNGNFRFAHANWPADFEECANENLFETHLCPDPGIDAEILRDYTIANNFTFNLISSYDFGIAGSDDENRSVMQLLASNKIDFTGFDWSFIHQRLSKFGYSFPISTVQLVAVVQNPAGSSYIDILHMHGEVGLCVATLISLIILFGLRISRLGANFWLFEKFLIFNWEFFQVIFGIILTYFTGIIAINMFRNPAPKMPFETFQQLQQLVIEKKFSVLTTNC